MKKHLTLLVTALLFASGTWAAKQKIIVRLREPLRAEPIKIRLPEVKNARGETRDLETRLDLGDKPRHEQSKVVEAALRLDMQLRPVGKGSIQVTLTLPKASFVEVYILDFYGKNIGVVAVGQLPSGTHALQPFDTKEGSQNGIKFLTLKINGKVAMKKVLTKVR